MKRLILIDAHAIIHRAYHALPPLTTPDGQPINAVYGFTTILLRILRELNPDYIAAAFDLPGPTFRHVAYARYKAHRPETPSELSGQFLKTEELLRAFGITVFQKEGYEADDIIGTIVKKLEKQKGFETIIVTGDLDALQLVRSRVSVYLMKKGISETTIYSKKDVENRYGLAPSQLADFKGLRGDQSDNIPGVKGIGEKTATELLKDFGSIEKIYQALKRGSKKISEPVREKLTNGAEEARFSKELATISTEAPIFLDTEKLRWREISHSEEIKKIFQKFGFFSLLKRLEAEKVVAPPPLSKSQTSFIEIQPKPKPGWKIAETVKDLGDLLKTKIALGLILHENELFLISSKAGEVIKFTPHFLKTIEAKYFFSKRNFLVYDGKSVIHFLHSYALSLGKIDFDIMLASYLTALSGRDFSFSAIVSRELGRAVSLEVRDEFLHFFEIARLLEDKISQNGLRRVMGEIELPVTPILAGLEERGVLIDQSTLKVLSKKTDKAIKILTGEIHGFAGEDFNINSPRQISHIIFEKLGIKTIGLRKTKKQGVISTRESELEKLKSAHPIIQKILEYRELMKLKTTYIDSIPKIVNPKTHRIHTTFNQTGTATGRLSSSDPNLQNIPVQSEYGREIRKAFIAEKGYVFVSFDYSQIELRVAAHIADDKKMIEAFLRGLDIHELTAAEIYNIPLNKVTPDLRRAAKTLNFGVLYGMGPQAFAEATGFSRDEAKKFIEEYFEDFSGIQNYIVKTKQFVEEHGYVETIFGRRRYIPEIHSPNWQMRREAERMAINMPIQGTATGDIVKLAMIKIDGWITKEKLEDDVRMLLQVHDELVFEIRETILKKAAPILKNIMEHVADLKVPLVVDVKAGQNWGEQHRFI